MNSWHKREIRSFRAAAEGIAAAVRSERHMRFHLAAAALVLVLAAWLRLDAGDWLWLLAAIFVVCATETINTAIERLVDLATSEVHPLAKAAKDTAAGAVLMAALFAVAVGAIVLGPPLWQRLFG